MAAGSLAKATIHEPVGTKPLWGHPGWQLPAYIQHIANDLREKRGMSTSRAIATAIAAVKRWAAGAGNVDAETRAAARKALAEWEKLKAKAAAMGEDEIAFLDEDDLDALLSQEGGLYLAVPTNITRLEAVESGLLDYISNEKDMDDKQEARSLLERIHRLIAKDRAENAAGHSLPSYSSFSDEDAVYVLNELFFSDATEALLADDGLIWKTIMREGKWKLSPGPGQAPQNKPITVIATGKSDPDKLVISLSELKKNFEAGAVEHVSIPTSHNNKVYENTGFIRALRIGKDEKGRSILEAGMDFTEPDIKQKVLNGTIANTSAGVLFDYLRKEDGKKFGAVLEHGALTNRPWLTGMTPFGMAADAEEVTVMTFSEEEVAEFEGLEDDFSNEELEALMSDDAAAEGEADVNLAQGKAKSKPYGNVTYADPGYQSDKQARYPIDTETHIRAAWSYINKAKNAAAYSGGQLKKIKARIRAAMKRIGADVNMSDDALTIDNEAALSALLAQGEETPITTKEVTAVDADELKSALAEKFGLSEEEIAETLEENKRLKLAQEEGAVKAKLTAWEGEKKSPAVLKVAEAVLLGEQTASGVNLSEDGKTVELSLAEVVERLVNASPAVNLEQDKVTEKDTSEGTAPTEDDEKVELSDEAKAEARRLFLYEGKTEAEAVALAQKKFPAGEDTE